MKNYAIILGSDMFIGTNGILTVEVNGQMKEFFKIKETYRELAEGSYLTVDCDIKDIDNVREIKLYKSRPVVKNENVIVEYNHKVTHVKREDGSTIIKVEQLDSNDPTLPQDGPVSIRIKQENLEAIIRITGDFCAGPYKLKVDSQSLKVGGKTSGGNLMVGTGGLKLTSMGFSI